MAMAAGVPLLLPSRAYISTARAPTAPPPQTLESPRRPRPRTCIAIVELLQPRHCRRPSLLAVGEASLTLLSHFYFAPKAYLCIDSCSQGLIPPQPSSPPSLPTLVRRRRSRPPPPPRRPKLPPTLLRVVSKRPQPLSVFPEPRIAPPLFGRRPSAPLDAVPRPPPKPPM
jgi:hypothetical protein